MAMVGVISFFQFAAMGLWVIFCLVWLGAAFGAKKNVVSRPAWTRLPLRVAVVALVLLVFARSLNRHLLLASIAVLLASPVTALIGALLCAAGIGFAVWARTVIGANWGMPMTLKRGHELVTTGPYAYVRHPIYFGVLLAMVGSVLVISLLWLLVLFVNAVQFLYAARREEQLMLKSFPEQYAAYMQRTKMIVPFVI
jgi:protein-S-isoprenylcysteine O-methyltransferase Ste14